MRSRAIYKEKDHYSTLHKVESCEALSDYGNKVIVFTKLKVNPAIAEDIASILELYKSYADIQSKKGFAPRPGWHLSDLPFALHIGTFMNKFSKPTVRPDNQVWAEVEVSADVDWQPEANKRAKLLLSAKRAAQGARGVVIAEGSTLMEQNTVVKNLEDTLFWIEKGAEITAREIDFKLTNKFFFRILVASNL